MGLFINLPSDGLRNHLISPECSIIQRVLRQMWTSMGRQGEPTLLLPTPHPDQASLLRTEQTLACGPLSWSVGVCYPLVLSVCFPLFLFKGLWSVKRLHIELGYLNVKQDRNFEQTQYKIKSLKFGEKEVCVWWETSSCLTVRLSPNLM